MDQVKFFKGCLPQISLGPFLIALSHIIPLLSNNPKQLFQKQNSVIFSLRRKQLVVRAVRGVISGRPVGKIITIILSFRVGGSKNKKYRSLMSRMKATISLYSVIQRCQVHQSFLFCLFCCKLEEKDHIKSKINSKKYTYMLNQYYYYYYYYYFDLAKTGSIEYSKKFS